METVALGARVYPDSLPEFLRLFFGTFLKFLSAISASKSRWRNRRKVVREDDCIIQATFETAAIRTEEELV